MINMNSFELPGKIVHLIAHPLQVWKNFKDTINRHSWWQIFLLNYVDLINGSKDFVSLNKLWIPLNKLTVSSVCSHTKNWLYRKVKEYGSIDAKNKGVCCKGSESVNIRSIALAFVDKCILRENKDNRTLAFVGNVKGYKTSSEVVTLLPSIN